MMKFNFEDFSDKALKFEDGAMMPYNLKTVPYNLKMEAL